jgi:hypothetical protein
MENLQRMDAICGQSPQARADLLGMPVKFLTLVRVMHA